VASHNSKPRGAVVIPNWNGEQYLADCLRSLQRQTLKPRIIVVDNGSVDGSVALVERGFPGVELILLPKNTGFTGGVNAGIRACLATDEPFVALLNNDAVAEPGWLAALVSELDANPKVGIATAKITNMHGTHLDSTGEFYTTWGLSFARGRGETDLARYDGHREIFGASGGASIFRTSMLKQIGLFDDDFFAYYEDADLSFRAQLAGWQVRYVPEAVVRHRIGATAKKVRGFTTFQTLKNLPLLCLKNVPARLLLLVLPRLFLAYTLFFWSAVARGQGGIALKGWLMSVLLTPKKLIERRRIQRSRQVPAAYIGEVLVHDLPPDATRLSRFVHPFNRNEQKRNTE
jgi:GT2 family glycosyltransferase